MKQNPCRYCALAYVIKGRHYPYYNNKCHECENIKKHKEYLRSQRKFDMGTPVETLEELLKQEYVFVIHHNEIPYHVEVLKSWQLRIVLDMLENGKIYRAVRRKDEKGI